MSKKLSILILLVLFINSNAITMSKYEYLPEVEIINPDLNQLVEEFMIFEKTNCCYESEAIYVIAIYANSKSLFYFSLSSIGKRKYANLSQDKFCFEKSGHLIFVRGDEPPESWFKLTGQMKKIVLDEPIGIIDNGYSEWHCRYENGEFSVDEKIECRYKPAKNN